MRRVRLTVDRGSYCSEITADSDKLTMVSEVVAEKGSGAIVGEGTRVIAEDENGVIAEGRIGAVADRGVDR